MKKIVVLIITLMFLINVRGIEITSSNAIMYNLNDDSIIYEKNIDEKVPIASLTKIVTAITIIDNTSNLDEKVTIKSDMLSGLNGYAKVGLKVGDTLTVEELLYALMLPSAADSAQALAIYKSGTIDAFSNLMNEEIKKIGVSSSHFDNPVGMDSENNYSTVSDLAKILKYSLKNEKFKIIFESNTYYIKSINKNIIKTLSTTSQNYKINTSIIKGAKTGFTTEAGLCLASTATLNDVDYLIVIVGSPIDYPYQIDDTINLYNYYNDNYGYKVILEKNVFIDKIKIKYGKKKYYELKSLEEIKLYLENDIELDKIEYEYKGVEEITKKIKKGDKLGIVNVKYYGETLFAFDVYLNEDIEYHNFILYGLILFCFIFIIFLIKKIKTK